MTDHGTNWQAELERKGYKAENIEHAASDHVSVEHKLQDGDLYVEVYMEGPRMGVTVAWYANDVEPDNPVWVELTDIPSPEDAKRLALEGVQVSDDPADLAHCDEMPLTDKGEIGSWR